MIPKNQREQNKLLRQKNVMKEELKKLPKEQQGKVKVARERKVKIERTLQTFVILHSGLKEDEQVILTNLDIMHDGCKASC